MTESDPDTPAKPVMRGNRRVLCHVDEIGEAGKGFILERIFKDKPDARTPVFVIPGDEDGVLYCYMNVCPHQGTHLEFKPDTFLDVDRKLILCSTHWALFRKEDGYCVKGPCVGRSLTQLPVMVDDDGMVLFGA
ncbi:MAG: Rieske (2Fe-2S) protein [Proteobacteria bacterium]|nr:Rieske (2Fe-2S) protein [Pseudomonadota bacterium]